MDYQDFTLAQLRNDGLPSFELTERIGALNAFFEQSNYSHVAITQDGWLVGCVPNEVLTPFEASESVAVLAEEWQHFSVQENAYWLEALEKMLLAEADIIPVVDEQRLFLGYYLLEDLELFLARTPFLTEGGTVIVVSVTKEGYALSQLTQIVESTNTRILGVLQTADHGSRVEITMKVVSEAIALLLAELRRYDYRIESALYEDLFAQQLRERSAYFEKYLNP
ncbi:MAG: hypothetical protein RLZZ242_1039 [Bacteroidota bacterium]